MLGVVLFVIGMSAWSHRRSAARKRSAGATPGDRPGEPGAALPLHRAASARESILVVDIKDRIRLINESAASLLGTGQAFPGALLGEAAPRLLYLLETWRQRTNGMNSSIETLVSADGARMLRPGTSPRWAMRSRPRCWCSWRHEPDRGEGAAAEARGAGPAQRQHRP